MCVCMCKASERKENPRISHFHFFCVPRTNPPPNPTYNHKQAHTHTHARAAGRLVRSRALLPCVALSFLSTLFYPFPPSLACSVCLSCLLACFFFYYFPNVLHSLRTNSQPHNNTHDDACCCCCYRVRFRERFSTRAPLFLSPLPSIFHSPNHFLPQHSIGLPAPLLLIASFALCVLCFCCSSCFISSFS